MQRITACSFIYNEGKDIKDCLENIAPHVDEIVIVDMDSQDNTAELAYGFTKDVYKMPHMICGDQYKMFLAAQAKGDWLLWFYPDERFSQKALSEMHRLIESTEYDAYAFMRHEYRDGIRLMPHGTIQSPNYQNRLHRKGNGIFYTELVHAELHGRGKSCYLTEDYFMEHRKTDVAQNFDGVRTYCEMKHLLWKYRDTKIEPYKTYLDSYRRVISESEAKNEDGSREISPAEEHWYHWWNHKDDKRVPLVEWKLKTSEDACNG